MDLNETETYIQHMHVSKLNRLIIKPLSFTGHRITTIKRSGPI